MSDLRRQAARRLLRLKEARDDLITFTEMMMPDPNNIEDPLATRYSPQRFHRALAAALEEVEAGRCPRLIITFPPRHGKTALAGHHFPAWFVGRDPYRHVITATYNQPFAEDYGRAVRQIISSDVYKNVFPETALAKGEAASDRLKTTRGGMLAFVGRGGSTTGRGGDLLIVDDPLKDRAEANSPTIRNELWDWWNDTFRTRVMSDTGAIIVIQTRWHEDDLVGRLIDPTNPEYREKEAKRWKIINFRALAEDDDVLGRKPGEALWPERFSREYLEEFRAGNALGFSALYQQRPTPLDGDLITREMITTYRPEELPTRLRYYAASDHAVSQKQRGDYTVLLVVGVDEYGCIWVVDAWRRKQPSDKVVEQMLRMAKKWKPLIWWAEQGHISKAIGPFLFKRMRETGTYINVREQHPAGDKEQRAQSIISRMGMGMVKFPESAPWMADARSEMLKFPQGRHDDFVDALAHIGLGLEIQIGAPKEKPAEKTGPAVGTFGWVKRASDFAKKRERARMTGGF